MITLFMACWASLLPWQNGPNPVCQPLLQLESYPGELVIQAKCESRRDVAASYKYELLVVRHGKAGTSRNTQRGSAEVSPHQVKTLSQVRLSWKPKDTYLAYLRIFDANDNLIAQDSASYAGAKQTGIPARH